MRMQVRTSDRQKDRDDDFDIAVFDYWSMRTDFTRLHLQHEVRERERRITNSILSLFIRWMLPVHTGIPTLSVVCYYVYDPYIIERSK